MGAARTDMTGVKGSWKNIKQYADRIGAVHLAEENPPRLHDSQQALYYGAFNPVFRDEFHEYDNVLFLDSDLYAVEGLEESVFDRFDADIGICTEPLQPRLRATTKVGKINKQQDELWAKNVERRWSITLPRTPEGLLKVYNTGVVLYSNKGMITAKRDFLPFAEYINYVLSIDGLLPFYAADQNYIHTTLFASKTNFVELDNGWNTLVTFHERNRKRVLYDRTQNTKLVHIQLRKGSLGHNITEQQSWKIVNRPTEEWGLGCKNVIDEVKLA